MSLRCVCAQVPVGDNYFAALNSAVFSDGSFVFIPKGVKCPMELSTYFRINASETGQVGTDGDCMLVCMLDCMLVFFCVASVCWVHVVLCWWELTRV